MKTRIFLLSLGVSLLGACGGRTGLLELDLDAGPVTDSVPHCVHPAVTKSCQGGWCIVPPGCFRMGSPKDEACRLSNETAHRVSITRSFIMAANEVTQAEFSQVMGYAPSYFKSCAACPVEQVTWSEAAAYCNALSAREKHAKPCYRCTGSGASVKCQVAAEWNIQSMHKIVECPGYRLPTEAEWEYAFRAGTMTHYYSGDLTACTGKNAALDKIAWYDINSGKRTRNVARKQANGWGLHDMAGNVWEWVHDRWRQDLGAGWVNDPVGPNSGDGLGLRGGSWDSIAGDMRAAFREKSSEGRRYNTVGFRCVGGSVF